MHVCLLFDGRFSTDERARSHAVALHEAGHTITVVCRGASHDRDRETIDGIDVRRLPDETLYAGLKGKLDGVRYALQMVNPAWLRAVEEIADERAIDACGVTDLRLVKTGLRVGDAHDVPVIADLPGNTPALERRRNRTEGWLDRFRNPRALARRLFHSPWRQGRLETGPLDGVDRLVTTCEEARARYVRAVGVDPERVSVVHDTTSALDTFETSGHVDRGLGFDPEAAFVVTAFANGPFDTDLERVVTAAARAADEVANLQLVLVGDLDRETTDALETQARRELAGGRVTFRTEIDPDRLPTYVVASDVCVFPTHPSPVAETAIPPTLFRALATGVPVVTTDVGPASRIVGEADAGRVIPTNDRESLTAALVALADPETAAEHGANGRRAVESRYDAERDASRLASIYESLSWTVIDEEGSDAETVSDRRTARTGGSTAP
ncbi:glycosyltransferase [Halococcus saccharolyticus DSM 5350]|uniref:Glycosyltransferase n=1 Tax=Halococcus saccharolyticus DSM 5350 TaxID=1227455 RepID=M0MIZ9_9EURY|nr:glycosyltransferase family 4 protein [Halococcus saccharolyticus]EMA45328.1 glycosyltransferase [Halococcus saccharolyticus DSM 5350]